MPRQSRSAPRSSERPPRRPSCRWPTTPRSPARAVTLVSGSSCCRGDPAASSLNQAYLPLTERRVPPRAAISGPPRCLSLPILRFARFFASPVHACRRHRSRQRRPGHREPRLRRAGDPAAHHQTSSTPRARPRSSSRRSPTRSDGHRQPPTRRSFAPASTSAGLAAEFLAGLEDPLILGPDDGPRPRPPARRRPLEVTVVLRTTNALTLRAPRRRRHRLHQPPGAVPLSQTIGAGRRPDADAGALPVTPEGRLHQHRPRCRPAGPGRRLHPRQRRRTSKSCAPSRSAPTAAARCARRSACTETPRPQRRQSDRPPAPPASTAPSPTPLPVELVKLHVVGG